MFSVAGNPGIKVVDVGVMLGVHRTTLEKNGVRLVKLDQSAKIEEYWTQYEDQRKKKPPASPYPIADMHPVLDIDGKVVRPQLYSHADSRSSQVNSCGSFAIRALQECMLAA
jgi:hypothetical protein